MTRADLKHGGKIQDAREEMNRQVRYVRIESTHSTESIKGMGSRSHDLGAELGKYSLTVDCETISNEENVAKVVLVTGVEVEATGFTAMFAQIFSNLLLRCLTKRLGGTASWEILGNILGGCLLESVFGEVLCWKMTMLYFSVRLALSCFHKS